MWTTTNLVPLLYYCRFAYIVLILLHVHGDLLAWRLGIEEDGLHEAGRGRVGIDFGGGATVLDVAALLLERVAGNADGRTCAVRREGERLACVAPSRRLVSVNVTSVGDAEGELGDAVSWWPVSRLSLPSPYTEMCSMCFFESFSSAAKMAS